MDYSEPPKLWVPPKPAIVRANTLKGLPSWAEMQRREKAMRDGSLFPIFAPGAAVSNVAISNTGGFSDTVSRTTYSMTDSTGSAAGDRITYVAFASRANVTGRSIVSVTIGGNAATPAAVGNYSDGSNSDFAALYYLANPTGSSAELIVTFSGAMLRFVFAYYRVTGTISATPYDTATDTTGDPLDGNVDTVVGGGAIGVVNITSGSAGNSWTGLTEDLDAAIFGAHQWSTAFGTFVAAETPRTVNVNVPGTPTTRCLAVASLA